MATALEQLPSLTRLSPVSQTSAVEKLVARLRASDAALHERALRELLPDVRWWTRSLVGRHPDADDAVQEALTEIACALHRFEGRSSLRTLARRITVRTVLRYVRRVRRTQGESLSAGELAGAGGDPEQMTSAHRTAERLHAHVAQLVPKRRVAFVLCALEGLTPSEAAREVGCSALAMRGRLHQARKELQARLLADDALGDALGVKG
ncbi:MAG: RNA polymerase sigma factor [Sandaracinaceae bacterium]